MKYFKTFESFMNFMNENEDNEQKLFDFIAALNKVDFGGYVYQDEDGEAGVCAFSKKKLKGSDVDDMFYEGEPPNASVNFFFIDLESPPKGQKDEVLKSAAGLGLKVDVIGKVWNETFG